MGLYEPGYENKAGQPQDQFVRRANYFKQFRDNPYQITRIDLSIARNNELITRVGDLIKIVHGSDNDANMEIRLNMKNSPAFIMQRYRKIETYYEKIFITNEAQEDSWVDILMAVKEWFDISDFFVG